MLVHSSFQSLLTLQDFLDATRAHQPQILAHWQQGEFHHDLVFSIRENPHEDEVIVVSTNCNGGIKELIFLDAVPERWALWHWRCPDNPEFQGELPPIRCHHKTVHWFEPCELLAPEARSEYKPEFRKRQRGGGWLSKDDPQSD
ncbi:MAG: hypothetical protein H6510_06410 [Acidobacteria bacterium]|nr:hypothetical protein [Acidobacteriota bacterium]MCB9397428.1 hypothetical protein [Acidobacteriota bacterium]